MHCRVSPLSSHHGPELWLNSIPEIQPLFLRADFLQVSFHHKHCSWVSSILLLHLPSPKYPMALQVIVLIGIKNITPGDVEAGEWPNPPANDLNIAVLGPHLHVSKMTRPSELHKCQRHKCLINKWQAYF